MEEVAGQEVRVIDKFDVVAAIFVPSTQTFEFKIRCPNCGCENTHEITLVLFYQDFFEFACVECGVILVSVHQGV